jgi:hypothetical protein
MPRRKKIVELEPTKFFRFPELSIDGFTIEKGDIIKVQDEWGMRFKFDSLVTNIETGAQWVDCFEVYKARTGVLRSFKIERIKRIPKRRGRRVKRGTTSETS